MNLFTSFSATFVQVNNATFNGFDVGVEDLDSSAQEVGS